MCLLYRLHTLYSYSEGDGMIYCMARHRDLEMQIDGELDHSETQPLAQTQI